MYFSRISVRFPDGLSVKVSFLVHNFVFLPGNYFKLVKILVFRILDNFCFVMASICFSGPWLKVNICGGGLSCV